MKLPKVLKGLIENSEISIVLSDFLYKLNLTFQNFNNFFNKISRQGNIYGILVAGEAPIAVRGPSEFKQPKPQNPKNKNQQ